MRFDTPQLCVLQPRGGMARSGGSNVNKSLANVSSDEASAQQLVGTDDDDEDDGLWRLEILSTTVSYIKIIRLDQSPVLVIQMKAVQQTKQLSPLRILLMAAMKLVQAAAVTTTLLTPNLHLLLS